MACPPNPGRVCILGFLCGNGLADLVLIRDDRPLLKIPKSFDQLQDLNYLLKKYRDIYPYRIFVCYVTTYLLSVIP